MQQQQRANVKPAKSGVEMTPQAYGPLVEAVQIPVDEELVRNDSIQMKLTPPSGARCARRHNKRKCTALECGIQPNVKHPQCIAIVRPWAAGVPVILYRYQNWKHGFPQQAKEARTRRDAAQS
ncbi:Mutatorlike Transposase [Phytophthora cinnamomi]|uniref:Mutatorlike Transposase n=1 Tax=Phytophthora cinnamomi TaxID=4785 RepID=UPI00355AA93A|nr:Mutatorlike Transposase [Phytophthora cinnamomi]